MVQQIGDGASPQTGQKIKVHYTGKLADGTVFDSGDISFAFDQGQVIKGWDEGSLQTVSPSRVFAFSPSFFIPNP